MIAGLAALLICQLTGEIAVRSLNLPLPGPVLGLILLLVVFVVRLKVMGRDDLATHDSAIGRVADGLLGNLGVLFVPAGVGVIQYLGLIGSHATAILLALVASTVLALVVTVLTFVAVRRLMAGDDA